MNPLPCQLASQLASTGPQTQWLVEGLWSDQAVGILGGEPKCCKSFLALDVAVSVASGAACQQEREALDEKLYFEVFALDPKPAKKP